MARPVGRAICLRLSKSLTSMQEGQMILHRQKALGRVFPSEDGKRSGLHPLEKMLAFLRSVSNFFDTLRQMARPVGRAICLFAKNLGIESVWFAKSGGIKPSLLDNPITMSYPHCGQFHKDL